jgi:hypothetical protein
MLRGLPLSLSETGEAMTDRTGGRISAVASVDTPVSFAFRVVHGADSARRSEERRAVTKSLSLSGLVFEIPTVDVDGLHISFTEESFGRNYLEIVLDPGRKLPPIDVLGQVEWYESRTTPRGDIFIVGVIFVDIQADAIALLKSLIRRITSIR